ncbi:MAG: phage tail family protein [Muribaculaceae bacterium]|nr:phage tail family protein [Muribaculaceae bacterium]
MMIEDVAARFVRDDGLEFIVDETDWGLTGIEGADAPDYEIFTQKNAVTDGSVVTGSHVGERDLQLSAAVMDASKNDQMRARVLAFFNPKYTYKIYLTYMGAIRWIQGRLKALKAPSGYIYTPQSFSAYFLCEKAYWQSVDDFGQDIAAVTPKWGWPYMDHPLYGRLADLSNFAREVVFEYDGDVPAAPTIILTADGEVTDPAILCQGSCIRIFDTMMTGDEIIIMTHPARVTKNGQNILNHVDRTSDFAGMRMQPGKNKVRYEAGHGDNNLHVVLRYNKQYLGV